MIQLPRISIVLPVLNSVATIEKAIASVLNQDYENIELIILDAGSTDGTVEVIKRYESKIAYWHSKPDGSPGLAINVGLSKATGEITGQLMADDWYEPGTFALAAKAYIDNPTVDIISFCGRIVRFDANEKVFRTLVSYTTEAELAMTLQNMCFGIPALDARFIAKRYLEKIGLLEPFDSQGKHNFSTDRELLIRAAVLGCNNVFVPHLGHTYLAHEDSATFGKNRANQNKILQEHMDLVTNYFGRYALKPDQKELLKAWYIEQSVRLFIFSLLAGKIQNAYQVVKQGLRFSASAWTCALFSVPTLWLTKKVTMSFKAQII